MKRPCSRPDCTGKFAHDARMNQTSDQVWCQHHYCPVVPAIRVIVTKGLRQPNPEGSAP
jgi:hypothetical protein